MKPDSTADAKIRELFATILGLSPEQITDQTRPADLKQWDSMQHLILVSGFEEEFGLDLDPEEAVEMYADYATFKSIVLREITNQE